MALGAQLTQVLWLVLRRGLQLAIGLPIGVAGTTLVGWLLAGLALRPVERMRRETEDIAQEELGRRLRVPATGDELARLDRPSLVYTLPRWDSKVRRDT